jgi:peptidyl-prolyl cis-trans isomerase D
VLKFIRRNATAWWVKAMFWAIVIVFVGWGVGTMGGQRGQFVARVNGEIIDQAEFERAHRNMQRFYEDLYKDALTPEILKQMNLRGRTVDQLISVRLLRQEAERLGLAASDTEVRDAIAAMPVFQIDGVTNKETYVRVLRANGMSPGEFQEAQREEILVDKLRDLVTAGVQVSEADVRPRFDYDKERVDLFYVKIDRAQFADKVELKEEDVKAYHEANSESFRVPDRVDVEYLLFANANLEADAQITEADVRQYYDGHQDEFRQEEQVRARHILIRVPEDADDAAKAEARRRADDALAKVKAGADFATVATETSEDSSASRGGDLGMFRRGLMVPEFEAAAFALEPGQVSEVVETQFGFHIIKTEEKTPPGTRTFDEVSKQIEAKLRSQKAQEMSREKAEKGHVDLAAGKSLQEIAAANGLEVRTAGPLSQGEVVPGVGGAGLANAALSAEVGAAGPVVTTPEGMVLFRVTQKHPSHVPDLAAIREQVEKAVRDKAAGDKAKTTADELLVAAKEKGLAAAAQEKGLTVQESGPFGRTDPQAGTIGAAPALNKESFELTLESPVSASVHEVGGAYVVAALNQRFPADTSIFDLEKEKMIKSEEARLKGEVLTNLVTSLREQAEIVMGAGYESATTGTL